MPILKIICHESLAITFSFFLGTSKARRST